MSGDEHAQLAALGRRLGDWEPAWGFALGEVPRTAGWLSPAQIDPGQVGKWLEEQARQLDIGPAVAAAYLGWGLEYRLVNAVIAALLVGPVVPDGSPDNVLLQISEVGRSVAVRFRSGRCHRAELGVGAERWVAQGLVATMGPVVDAIRAVSGSRLPGLWGMVADSVAGTAVRLGDRLGPDPARTARLWARAQHVLEEMEEMEEDGAVLRKRPWLLPPPPHDTSGRLRMVRSTCCQYCNTPQAKHGPAQERWCSTCPAATGNRRPAMPTPTYAAPAPTIPTHA